MDNHRIELFLIYGFLPLLWPAAQELIRVNENKERWMELCELASKEQDPRKLSELVEEIDRLLEDKQNRLKGRPSATDDTSSKTASPASSRRNRNFILQLNSASRGALWRFLIFPRSLNSR